MNRDEAKSILHAYRSDRIDGRDPQFRSALALASEDPELAQWLENEKSIDFAFSRKIRAGIQVPQDLKQRLLELRTRPQSRQRSGSWSTWLAVAAALTILVGAGTTWRSHFNRSREARAFRSAMALAARDRSPNHVDIVGLDGEPLRQWLTEHRGDPNFTIPSGLADRRILACKLIPWHGAVVTMLCFQVDSAHLDLFVIDAAHVPGVAPGTAAQFGTAGGLSTATWSRDGKVYLLIGGNSIAQLQQLV